MFPAVCHSTSRHNARNSPVSAWLAPRTRPHAPMSFTSPPPIPPMVIPARSSGSPARTPKRLGCPGGSMLVSATRTTSQSGMVLVLISMTAAKDRAEKKKASLIMLHSHVHATFFLFQLLCLLRFLIQIRLLVHKSFIRFLYRLVKSFLDSPVGKEHRILVLFICSCLCFRHGNRQPVVIFLDSDISDRHEIPDFYIGKGKDTLFRLCFCDGSLHLHVCPCICLHCGIFLYCFHSFCIL